MGESINKDGRIAVGFKGGAQLTGMSPRFLELAAKEPDPAKRLKTVRVARRRLIKIVDLEDWFNRVAHSEETQAA